ncbi:hypothetical protein K3495_g7952 [Podosphaera aphanis]|nr:hypothetical protein K3495_g7952 [Podosphaera aphanis]
MSGLVSYSSSEEDEGQEENCSNSNEQTRPFKPDDTKHITTGNIEATDSKCEDAEPSVPPLGPSPNPREEIESRLEEDLTFGSLSPHSKNRVLLRNLTLPTLPTYEIPPSPPASPKGNTNAKFHHFLELKKRGVHFNHKLAKSAALKNPGLMQKLMDFAGIDQAGQYSTTLTKAQWDPAGFPPSAFREELKKSQQIILKKEEEKVRGQRERVDFIPASGSEKPPRRAETNS